MSYRDIFNIKRRVSYSKKQANDFQRQKTIIDAYDSFYGHLRDTDKVEKGRINYDLLNGRLDLNLYDSSGEMTIMGEKVKLTNYDITHYPMIAQLGNAIVGEYINRPFLANVQDNSPSARSMYMKRRDQLMMDWLDASVIAPAKEMSTMNWMQQYGVQDVFMLTPEQQQQMASDVDARVKQEVPKEVFDFLKNGYRNPNQKVLQELLNAHLRIDDVTYKSIEGFKRGVAMGETIYRVDAFNDFPKFDVINEMYFTWGGSQNTEWVQEGAWCRYEEWLRYEDVMQLFGSELKNKDLKYLEELVEPIGGFKTDYRGPDKSKQANLTGLERQTQYVISLEENELLQRYGKVDVRTNEGQSKMVSIMSEVAARYGSTYGYSLSNYGFRVAHFNFIDMRKLKRVSKLQNGKISKYWLDESYEEQADDVDIKEVWVKEAWSGYKIGSTSDPVYAKIERIPWQFTSLNNPFTAELSYYGRQYNTHLNSSKNVSHIDRGKPWQLEFDTEMAALKHDLKTHIGQVFMMVMDLKPDNMQMQEWIDTIVNFKLMPINLNKNGMNRVDPAMLRNIEMGKISDIGARVQRLEFIRANLMRDMFFSEARAGSVGQYATQANIQTNQVASYNQTESVFSTHRKILDKALTAYLKCIRYYAKMDPSRYENVLDDIGMAYLASMPLWEPFVDVTVGGSGTEIQELERIRSLAMQLSSTAAGQSPKLIVNLALATNKSEILDILDIDHTERLEKEMAIRQENQQTAMAQIEAQERMAKEATEREYNMHKETLESQERRQAIDSSKFKQQQDVNMNQVADAIEKALLELAAKKEMHSEEIEVKHRELDIKEKELGIKEKAITSKSRN